MSKLFLTLVILGSLSTFALTPVEMLPSVSQVKITVHDGGGLAAVQPWAYLSVKIWSCAKLNLTVETEKKGEIVYIRLANDVRNPDCYGAPSLFEYNKQISSDATFEKYVVLNPIETITKE
jgi:hypothetical protein